MVTFFFYVVITMFFAVTLKVAQLPTYFWWILIAFVGFYVLLFLVMEFFTCVSNRKAGNIMTSLACKSFIF